MIGTPCGETISTFRDFFSYFNSHLYIEFRSTAAAYDISCTSVVAGHNQKEIVKLSFFDNDHP